MPTPATSPDPQPPTPVNPPANLPAGGAPAGAPKARAGRRCTAAGLTFALVTGALLTTAFAHTMSAGAARIVDAGGLAGAGGTVVAGTDGTATASGDGTLRASTVAYASFPDCTALLRYYREHARVLVGPYGLPGTGFGVGVASGGIAFAAREAAGSAAGGAPVSAPAPAADTRSDTGTNVQVAGVDEADVAKRVGDRVYSAAPSEPSLTTDPNGSRVPALTVARTRDGRAALLGRLTLQGWQPTQLLVDGTTVLLVGNAPFTPDGAIGASKDVATRFMPTWVYSRTRIVQVDVSDPTDPRVERTLDVDGTPVGTRLVDGVARVAVSGGTNRIPFRSPVFPQQEADGTTVPGTSDGGAAVPGVVVESPYDEAAVKRAERAATTANRRLVAASAIGDWIPRYALTEGAGTAQTRTGDLLSCHDVSAPSRFSGLDTMSLLTFDLRDPAGISRWDGAGVVASGAQLYATADHTFVATTPWQDWTLIASSSSQDAVAAMRRQRTQIHLFDTTGGASPVYVGSGEVPGFLLNQFSMDEHDGYLRVASTTMPQWWTGDRARIPSSSQVTVLRLGDSGLAKVGSVGGLGRTETIRSVRFLGDVGYVVTFRQTDPLYTIDLADPAAPRVAGELKILGYSAYLHPVGDGLVLGVGQDATAAGRTTGLQMTLFDVSDPAAPRRVDQVRLPGAWSDVEGDHHAFTFADGLALVPFTRWLDPGGPAAGDPAVDVPPAGEVDGGSTGSSGSGGTATVPAVPSYDAGVVAVRMTGEGVERRFADPVVLRPLGDGPRRVDPATGVGGPTPLRTFVGDGSVWTVTTGGIAAHDEQSLTRTDFAPF